jgi:glycosyltransferase involved in cell wall biosynthesis
MVSLKAAFRVLVEEGVVSFTKKTAQYGKIQFREVYFRLKILPRKRNIRMFPHDVMETPGIHGGEKAAFTICTKNYLHFALALRMSFLKYNPGWKFVIVVNDMLMNVAEMRYCRELAERGVDLMFIHALKNRVSIESLEEMLFKYTVLEASAAEKPFLLEYFLQSGFEKVVYLDADIYCLDSLHRAETLLDTYDIILTPHTVEPYSDEKDPGDLRILNAGTFNLGFIAVRNTGEVIRFCRWWQNHLFTQCYVDVPHGLHADQKWIDLVPSFFSNYYIVKDPGYNVAYWNLHERNVRKEGDTWRVNGEKLVFFHFSGITIGDIRALSLNQDRYTLRDLPSLVPLFKEYEDEILTNGFQIDRDWKYYYNYLPRTDIRIPDSLRRPLHKEILREVGNPFNPDTETLTRTIASFTRNAGERLQNTTQRQQDINSLFTSGVPGREEIDRRIAESFGVNIIGFLAYDFGSAITAQAFIKKVYETGVPFSLYPLKIDRYDVSRSEDRAGFDLYYTQNVPFRKNIIFVNAEVFAYTRKTFPEIFHGKHNSAVWWWEFENDFPFPDSFNGLDEVIVFSDFVHNAIRKHAPPHIPITKIRYPFMTDWKIVTSPQSVRERLGLSDEHFVFLFNFDFFSSYERKNPDAVVRAFSESCSDRKEARLIIKTSGTYAFPKELARLKKCVAQSRCADHITVVEDSYPRNEFMSLMNAVDCYVSLHRSEGFGLGMFEAMVMGKPVIGTAYGGNLEFMHEGHSLLVAYDPTTLKESFCGIYNKGWMCAEPRVSSAAEYMRDLCTHPERAREIGRRGKAYADEFCRTAAFSVDLYNLLEH